MKKSSSGDSSGYSSSWLKPIETYLVVSIPAGVPLVPFI
jgi:hypothetical protein